MPSEPSPEELEKILECARHIAGSRLSLLNTLVDNLDNLESGGSFDTTFAIAWARLFDEFASRGVQAEDVKRICQYFAFYEVLGEMRAVMDEKLAESDAGYKGDFSADREVFMKVQKALSVYLRYKPVSENGREHQ